MWGRDLDIDTLMTLKKGGSFKIEPGPKGTAVITIMRTGEPVQRFVCPSMGIANQMRLRLADDLAGHNAGAR